MLINSVQLVMGGGGLDNDGKGNVNGMKLLHDVYNIQNWHKHDKLTDIYIYIRGEEGISHNFVKLEEPALAR